SGSTRGRRWRRTPSRAGGQGEVDWLSQTGAGGISHQFGGNAAVPKPRVRNRRDVSRAGDARRQVDRRHLDGEDPSLARRVCSVVEGAPQTVDVRLAVARRMHAIGQQGRVTTTLQIDPESRSRKAGVTDAVRIHQVSTAPARIHQSPAKAAPLLLGRVPTSVLLAQVREDGRWMQPAAYQRTSVATHSA